MTLLVLVVDDEPDVEVLFRQQFRRELRAGRFHMQFAQSAPAALENISDAGDAVIILILALRPDVPIIMITAYGDAETKRKALDGGAEALLTKPIDFPALRTEIETKVQRAA